MNWFANNGDKLLAFLTGVSALLVTQATALHLDEQIVAWITLGSAIATLAHTLWFPGNTPPPPSGKQAGRASVTLLCMLIPALLVACATLGLQAPKSLDEQIAAADQLVTSTAQATDQALTAHQVTVDQAQRVSSLMHQTVPFLDDAKTAERAGDTAGANRNFALAQAILTSLQAYANGRSP